MLDTTREVVATQTKSTVGALAVALLFATLALGGCVGGIGQTSPDADADDTGPASADDSQDNQTPTNGDGGIDEEDNESVQDDGSGADDGEPAPPRTPDDAMPGHEPADTTEGMAHFSIEAEAKPLQEVPGVCAIFLRVGVDAERQEFFPTIRNQTIHNPGDLTFFDIHLSADSDLTDVSMELKNETGETVASADAFAHTGEYLFYAPEEGKAQDYTLEIWQSCADPTDRSYTVDLWFWTTDDWQVNYPFADVFTKTYEWGQVEVNAQAAAVSVVWGLHDPTGSTRDGSIDFGGYSWDGCASQGGGSDFLPCPPEPYTSISVVIRDDAAGQEVAAIFATCSADGDNWCGETDNLNDDKTTDNSGFCSSPPETTDPSCSGPNELRATFCGVVTGITRDANDDADGTGPGVWDQRGEQYENANGTYVEHPGVNGLAIFLRGPQRGGGSVCADANPYTGPTSGTITIIAFKG